MNCTRSPWAAAGLCSFVAALPASALQFGDPLGAPIFPSTDVDDIQLPTVGPEAVPSDHERFLVGDLTADGDCDGLLLAGGEAHAVLGLGRLAHTERLVSGVTGITLEEPVAVGGGQAVLVTTGVGLERLYFDGATGAFVAPIPLKTGVNWRNAPLIEAADLDGLGRSDLLMVGALDPSMVIGYYGDSSANYSPLFTATVPGTVVDVAMMDWGNNGTRDLIVLGTSDLRVVSGAGTVLVSWPVPAAGGSIEILAGNAVQPGDRLVWARRDATDSFHELLVLHHTQTAPTPVPMQFVLESGQAATDVDVTGLSSGDCDADGDVDLVVTHGDGSRAVVMGNRGAAAPSFGATADDYAVLTLGTPGAGESATAALADVDGDGRKTIVAPLENNGAVAIERALPAFDPGGAVTIPPGTPSTTIASAFYGVTLETVGGVEQIDELVGPLTLHLDLPPAIDIEDYTHLQVQVFEQDGTSVPLNAAGLLNELFVLPTPGQGDDADALAIEVDWGEAHYSAWPAGRHVYLALRMIEVQGTTFLARSPWLMCGFTINPDLVNFTNFTYVQPLQNNPYYVGETGIGPDFLPGSAGFNGSAYIGISAELSRLGDFTDVPMPPNPLIQVSPLPNVYFWN